MNRILFRAFFRLWAQALAIALVLACGVAIFLMAFGMFTALSETREAYYERNRFADVFATARRAPKTLEAEIAAINGVIAVQTRVAGNAILDLPGRVESAVGQLISLPVAGAPRLNVPLLRSGRFPDPEARDEVMVNEPFAQANGFLPGDVILATLDGKKRRLTITGTALSPEYIYTIGPGDMMPDNEGYGILWMPEPELAAAFDMSGAFNDVALQLERGAAAETVIGALDRLLEPYGSQGAHDRSVQQSNAFIDGELKQLKSMAYVLPPVFFGISIFLVNMVIGRIVALDRSEIGLMKALGYSDFEVSLHYILLAGLIAVVGVGMGIAVGTLLSHGLAVLYAEFFSFPYLIFTISPGVYVASAGLGFVSSVAGAARSAMAVARLAPAVAMSPPAPPSYSHSLLDRALVIFRLSQPTTMIVRNIMRWPARAGLTTLGVALAVAVLVSASFFQDALDEMVDTIFDKANRQDATLILGGETSAAAIQEVGRLPGVLQVEGTQIHVAELSNGHRRKCVAIEGRSAGADLARIVGADGRVVAAPAHGMLLSARLARQLDLHPGQMVDVAFLTGRRENHRIEVAGTVTSYIGLAAYMESAALDRLMRRGPRVSAVNVTLDGAEVDAFHAAVKDLPGLAGTVMLRETLKGFRDTIEENITISTLIYIAIAVLITVGVTYNSARIQLSERARDLAGLRILGFSGPEVSYILIGETALLVLLAQPLGWLLGAGLAAAMVAGFESDLYAIPLVLERDTFAWASVVVLVAASASALLVRRRLDRLDIIEVMKTRE